MSDDMFKSHWYVPFRDIANTQLGINLAKAWSQASRAAAAAARKSKGGSKPATPKVSKEKGPPSYSTEVRNGIVYRRLPGRESYLGPGTTDDDPPYKTPFKSKHQNFSRPPLSPSPRPPEGGALPKSYKRALGGNEPGVLEVSGLRSKGAFVRAHAKLTDMGYKVYGKQTRAIPTSGNTEDADVEHQVVMRHPKNGKTVRLKMRYGRDLKSNHFSLH